MVEVVNGRKRRRLIITSDLQNKTFCTFWILEPCAGSIPYFKLSIFYVYLSDGTLTSTFTYSAIILSKIYRIGPTSMQSILVLYWYWPYNNFLSSYRPVDHGTISSNVSYKALTNRSFFSFSMHNCRKTKEKPEQIGKNTHQQTNRWSSHSLYHLILYQINNCADVLCYYFYPLRQLLLFLSLSMNMNIEKIWFLQKAKMK